MQSLPLAKPGNIASSEVVTNNFGSVPSEP